jgi:TatA/E family protein of Tat protein translocase
MFGMGATELVVILVLALILLGPKRLPDVANSLGKAIRQFRKATRDLTDQLDIDDEVKQPFRELKAALRDEPAPYVPPAVVSTAKPAAESTPRPSVAPASPEPAAAATPVADIPGTTKAS